jgi:hypothetical protein
LKVQIIGSGDAYGAGGRFSTCPRVIGDDRLSILVDCDADGRVILS